MNYRRCLTPILAALLAVLTGPAPAAHAQPHLVSATPAPGSTVSLPPREVRLVFDHPLLAEGTAIRVTDQDRIPVDKGNGRIDPADPFALVVGMPVLFEGQYTVTYAAATVGASTVLSDSYTFTLDLPEPVLTLNVPANGESFRSGSVPIRMEARFIDFNVYDSKVRLYVDGQLHREWAGLRANVEGLGEGVHEIRTVLMQLDQEVPDTSTTVYIAVQRPDPGGMPRRQEALEPQTLSLPTPQLIGLLVLVAALLSLGLWLGRVAESG